MPRRQAYGPSSQAPPGRAGMARTTSRKKSLTDLTRADMRPLDLDDPLAVIRARFSLPERGVYLDGNSLGALPRQTPSVIADLVTRQWGCDLISSWNRHDWIGMPARLGAMIAPLVGARATEVIVCDTVSVNLFKLIASALEARPGRGCILSEAGNFPTDLYMAQGVARMRGDTRLRLAEADGIAGAIDETTAVVLLTHVHYKSGRKLNMAAITQAAHAQGALVLWDLSHSAGAVEVDLDGCGADLAVGCGYKYLNGGPGAPAFLFVASHLQDELQSPLPGWMGHEGPVRLRRRLPSSQRPSPLPVRHAFRNRAWRGWKVV